MSHARKTHKPGSHVDCPLCRESAALLIADGVMTTGMLRKISRRHNQAIRNQERDQAMRDAGLTKVRGAVSGKIYWE